MFDVPQGVSDAAIVAESFRAELFQQRQQTASRYNHELEDALAATLRDGTSPEWLADGNTEIQAITIFKAKSFLDSLPSPFQNPTIAPEPDGDISIEWYAEKRRLLSVSLSPDGTLHWAALFGNEDPRGSIQFTGSTPETILFHLTRILS